MKVLIGTNNKAKVKKYGTILEELGIEYCTPKDLNLDIDVDEIGSTRQENSEIKVVKVNVDDNSELTAEFGVRSIPAVYIYKGGEKTGQFVGMKGKEEIKAML